MSTKTRAPRSDKQLAIHATAAFLDFSLELRKTSKNAVVKTACGQLMVDLCLTSRDLQDVESMGILDGPQILALLKVLERICTFPKRTQAQRAAALNTWPELQKLQAKDQDAHGRARDGFRKFMTSKADLDARLTHLHSSLKNLQLKSSDVLYEGSTGPTKAQIATARLDDYSVHAKQLHGFLCAHCFCDQLGKSIATRLLLQANRTIDDLCVFYLLLVAHPHSDELPRDSYWQDVTIQMVRESNESKPRYLEPSNTQVAIVPSPRVVAPTSTFCSRLSGQEPTLLRMQATEKGFLSAEYEPRSKPQDMRDHPGVSLATVITNEALAQEDRLLLSLILAKSVWQYYDTPWMPSMWSKDCIYLAFIEPNENQTEGCAAFLPYLSGDLESMNQAEPSVHRLPKVLSLGIMLLEIELDIDIKTNEWRKKFKPTVNTDFFTAKDIYEKKENKKLWKKRATPPSHYQAIGKCLAPDWSCDKDDTEEIRDLLLEHVIMPLRALVKLRDIDDNQINGLEMFAAQQWLQLSQPAQAAPSLPACEDSKASATFAASTVKNDRDVQPPSSSHFQTPNGAGQTAADEYMARLIDRRDLLLGAIASNEQEPTRIAILDSGFDGQHPSSEYIEGYKDFVSSTNTDEHIDRTGHGTNGVLITFKVAPQAEVYVARVFDRSPTEPDTPSRVAAAIRHATTCWKVHIIAMSLGFGDEYRDIEKAIYEAQVEGIIVLAAVGNEGNRQKSAFPASMDGAVLRISSTDGKGKPSNHFNPAAPTLSAMNFGFLGEDVAVQTRTGDTIRVSGTSISTSIAAATAALLLDFSQRECCQAIMSKKMKLQSVAGISRVLIVLSEQDNNFFCFNPWTSNLKPSDTDASSKAKKCEYIAGTINRAL